MLNSKCFNGMFNIHNIPRKALKIISIGLLTTLPIIPVTHASDSPAKTEKSAIVLAAFGTSYDTAIGSLIGIQEQVQNAYPDTPVRFAFTSSIIRKIWHRRASDDEYQKNHPEVPQGFYQVKNVLGTMADLQNEGYKNIVVQTTLLSHGEEFIDLKATVDALASIQTIKEKWKPFNKVVLGRPLMGTWGSHNPYREDLDQLAEALASDVKRAKENNTALIYMGHGNDHLSTGLYYELQEVMNKRYPDVNIYVGLVEGYPNFDNIMEQLKRDAIQSVAVKPLMVVAGDHASNDMAGDDDDSWKVMLSKQNIKVTPLLEGLGSKESIQKIYLQHLVDAAKDANITLR
ncbi:sirohydrochlorin cobaltochelatase [Vibrio sp. DW001]|uniref:sirohydrochlorin cobaltochelatase n=1 Tax=Vibrio sp. DW001 TaxID=2912315 RepID=UPI0023B0502D|nr:sirohydrochlorin cobaltochelatase [Vibrio sp. DW001]WED28883.1 sirohydrochlorin cobaltochelatase [Vibrio sp. DW001]